MISTLNKRLSVAVLLAAMALPASGIAQGAYNDIVRDKRGVPVTDKRGNCVFTKWFADADQCTGRPVVYQDPAAASYLVFFDFDKATLTSEAKSIIRSAAQNAGSARIQVVGHADRSGTDGYNQRLSERRAAAVRKELARLGIGRNQITSSAKGESDPLVPTEDGVREPQNRRVELKYY